MNNIEKPIWNQPPEPEEGKPASKKELAESLRFDYVAKNPASGIDYYQIKRGEILSDQSLSDNEKLEIVRYYDKKRLALIVENEEEYNKYFNENHNTIEGKFIEGANSALMKKITPDNFLVFGPNVSFIAPKNNPISGLSFESNIDGIEYYDDKKTKMKIDLKIKEYNLPHMEHNCAIYIDRVSGKVRTATIPEGLQIKNPATYLKGLFNASKIELESILTVANLSEVPQYEPRPYLGNRVGSTNNVREIKPTKIGEQIKSTLPYRRRTIEDIRQFPTELDALLNNWSPQEAKILKDAGGGDMIIRIYEVQKNNYTLMGIAPDSDFAALEDMAARALQNGKAHITFEHVFRPPEIDNEDPGRPHRVHTRRLRAGITLIIGNKIPENEKKQISQIWKKRKKGQLTDADKNELTEFMNKYGINKDVNAEIIFSDGIHYKDGRFVPNSNMVGEHAYTL